MLTFIAVSEQGRLRYTDSRNKSRCAQLSAAEHEQIRDAIDDPQWRAALEDATRRGADYADSEEIGVVLGSWEGHFPTELAPAEMSPFLRILQAAIRNYFGEDLNW